MIEEIKEKWIDISSRKPYYLTTGEYELVEENYIRIKRLLIRLINNNHMNDNQINLVYEKIETYHSSVRRMISDELFILLWADDISYIEEMIEDCLEFELYEGASNLKKILDKLNS